MQKGDTYTGIIISNAITKEYDTQYKLKVTKIGDKSTDITVYIRVKGKNNLQYGDEILFQGKFVTPDSARNDKGFDYKQYLKSNGIVGTLTTNQVKIIAANQGKVLEKIACNTQSIMEQEIRKNIPQKEHQDILIGILLGNDEEIEQEIKEDFVNSSLSHILAVSGMHVAYIVTIVDYLLSMIKVGKRKIKFITILFLIFFISLANHTPSVRRACIMSGLGIFAGVIYQKSDVINNMSVSMLIILIQNPFAICNTGLILSYTATLGIVLLSPIFLPKIETRKKDIWNQKIKPVIVVSISSWIAIFPISMVLFRTISFTFIFSNIMVSTMIGFIIMLGMIASIPIHLPILSNILCSILNILLFLLVKISQIFSNISLSSIQVCPPNILTLILYYISVFFLIYQKRIKRKRMQKKSRKTIINKCG